MNTGMTIEASRSQAAFLVRRKFEIAHPGLTGRQLELERCVHATEQARRIRENPQFGPDHTLVAAYLEIASQAAEAARCHADDAVATYLDNGQLDLDGIKTILH